jgi:hydrogenase/urease accessory protein HupE
MAFGAALLAGVFALTAGQAVGTDIENIDAPIEFYSTYTDRGLKLWKCY